MIKIKRLLSLILLIIVVVVGCSAKNEFDLLILNGQLFDGTGADPIQMDIGINNDEIIAIGDLSKHSAKRIIDATGLAVAPGFIDLHAHLAPILELSDCESHIRQGVTTSLGGPDGSSPWPFKKHLDTLEQIGIGMNVAYLIGHNTIRKNIMGLENREPTDDELMQMQSQVSQAMDEGAFGISTGLKYVPGTFSKVDEVIALAKNASQKGGIYTTHLRDEGLGVFSAINEAITISKEADIPVILSHHKVIGKPMWGQSNKTLAMVDSSRALGLNILMDQYPYNASHTGISVLIPGWAQAGGSEDFKKRIANVKLRDSIKAGIIFNILNDRGGNDLARIQFAKVKWNADLEGKTLKEWCEQRGLAPSLENGADLVIEAQMNGGASCIYHAMDEKDVEQIMKHPQTMIASDGRLNKLGQGHPHPRAYSTFPRVLGHYVREKSILTLAEAIYKMTAFPANTLGLMDRGILKENMKADIVIFNPETVLDKATFIKPHQYPVGIDYVLINGQLTIDNGTFNKLKAGKVLRKK
tara:strand:+ start:138087 stop:139667 length:1581 start_codon:yes stop_codon:yes gene_type:complete